MNVLLIYPRLLSRTHSVGGVAEFLFAMTPLLRTLGVTPIIYAGNKQQTGITGPVEVAPGVRVYSGPIIKPGWLYSRRKMRGLIDLCRTLHIDVVHAQGTYTAGFMARLIHRALSIPYVITSHSDVLPTNTKRLHRGSVRARYVDILKDAACVTHLTPMMAEASHAICNTAEKSYLIGNGIAVNDWTPYATLPTRPYLFSIGRLERGKGFHILIQMFARLVKRGVKQSLIIAGGGAEAEALAMQATEAGLAVHHGVPDLTQMPEASVIFTGYLRGKAKYEFMAQAQVVLFATQPDLWDEAFGIVMLEVMAAGRALVASDMPVVRYLMSRGMQAVPVAPADADAWAEATLTLLNQDSLRAEMAAANQAAALSFDWADIAKQYHQVYAAALS